jgi:hypothetical protein
MTKQISNYDSLLYHSFQKRTAVFDVIAVHFCFPAADSVFSVLSDALD